MILSTYSPAELANILATENAVLLKNVKGLGLKTAQKIIVELKDKAAGLGSTGTGSPAQTIAAGTDETRTEATAALTMLGFGKAASEKAVQSILKETLRRGRGGHTPRTQETVTERTSKRQTMNMKGLIAATLVVIVPASCTRRSRSSRKTSCKPPRKPITITSQTFWSASNG